jgi:polyhydroxyalkanoate synthesis repressor PhaR
MAEDKAKDAGAPITIKKYANRRLYNTATSSYVTLDHLAEMVKAGQDFVVYDAKTGEDITRSVLTQIIFEEEAKGQNLLPISFLRKLISFYGDSLETMLPRYLEVSMESFTQNQEKMRSYMQEAFGDANPFRQMEEIGRQNAAMFQQALSMFAPFVGTTPDAAQAAAPQPEKPAEADSKELDTLRDQVTRMQEQLDRIAKQSKKD